MDVKKIRKHAMTAIITFIVYVVGVITLILTVFIKMLELERKYPDGIPDEFLEQESFLLLLAIFLITVIIIIFAIVHLIFYIISIIDASKFDDKTSMILLLVAVLVPFLGLIGLFLLRHQAKEYGINQAKIANRDEAVDSIFI